MRPNRDRCHWYGILLLILYFSSCNWLSKPGVILVSPLDGSRINLAVKFSWYVENISGRSYRVQIYLDKGRGPFDGWCEQVIDAGMNATELDFQLNPDVYSGAAVEWGVRVIIDDRRYESPVRRFRVE